MIELWSVKDINRPVAEFKEFERRFKFKPQLKYGWFHLKLYQMFQDLSLNLNRVLADLNRGSNSLNSISVFLFDANSFSKKKYAKQTNYLS